MNPADLQSELFAQLAEQFTGEAVFDCLAAVALHKGRILGL